MDGSYVQADEDGNVSCDLYSSCDATRVEDRFLLGLTVAPNPTTGTVTITLPSGFQCERVQWFDAMGRSLGEQPGHGVREVVDLGDAGPGVHYVTVTTADGWSTTRRVVVQ